MKLFLTLILSMSTSGTLAFLIYLIFVFLTRERISARLRYLSLKFCLMLFLVPLPLIKHLLVSVLFPKNLASSGNFEVFLDVSHSLNLTDTGLLFPKIDTVYQFLLLCWIMILGIILSSQFFCFLIFQKRITKYLHRDNRYDALLPSLKKAYGIRHPVSVYYSNSDLSPFTCGVFHSLIVFTTLVDEDSAPMILRHELQHIRTHDFLYRILALIAVLLHCFNPCIYLLFKELKEVQEMNCDEALSKDFSSKEKRNYGKILIDISAKAGSATAPAIYFSKTSKSFLKKRIRRITSPVHTRSLCALALSLIMCLTAAIPVYAYSPATIDWREGGEATPEDLENTDWIIISKNISPWYDIPEDECTFLSCDTYFILDTGTIIPLAGKISADLQANCNHSYQSGTLKQHILSGTGCVVITYSAQICNKCNFVKNKVAIGRSEHNPCPHK